MNWTCSTTKPFLKWRRTCHKSISSLTGVPARLLLAIFDWSIVTQINLESKKNKSREIPSTYFPCPVPSGLPHRLHCVPMNIKRCGFKVFGGEIFPRVQHKFNTKATLCNLPYIRKNLETICSPLTGVTSDSWDTPAGHRVYDACRGFSVSWVCWGSGASSASSTSC